jgi:hypothetical protein
MNALADPLDQAAQFQAEAIDREVRNILNKQPSKLTAIGLCHWCREPLETKQLFCDTDCSDDFEKSRRK